MHTPVRYAVSPLDSHCNSGVNSQHRMGSSAPCKDTQFHPWTATATHGQPPAGIEGVGYLLADPLVDVVTQLILPLA